MKRNLFFMTIVIVLLSLSFTACEEKNEIIIDAFAVPNPFDPTKDINVQSTSGTMVVKEYTNLILAFKNTGNTTYITIEVYDALDNLVWTYSKENTYSGDTANESSIIWGGQNDLGTIVSPGLYVCKIKIESGYTSTKRIDIWVE